MPLQQVRIGPFSLSSPPGWSLITAILAGPIDKDQKLEDMHTAKVVQPFQRNLVATMELVVASETPESYRKRQTKGLNEARVFWQVVGKPEQLTLQGDIPNVLTEQIVLGPSGERVRQLQLICIKDKVAYTIIATHQDGPPFEEAREEFRAILSSFSLNF